MRRIALNLFFAVALCAASNVASTAEGEWQTLFNGKNLSGWRANTAPDSYAVSEGVLTLHNTSKEFRSHLFYVGEPGGDLVKFKNFDLRIVCKGAPSSNSGIFFHTDLAERDGKKHLGSGYEIQLNSAARDGRKTGSLYAIADIGTAASSAWTTRSRKTPSGPRIGKAVCSIPKAEPSRCKRTTRIVPGTSKRSRSSAWPVDARRPSFVRTR